MRSRHRVELYHGLALSSTRTTSISTENAFLVMTKAFEEDYTNDETADHLERSGVGRPTSGNELLRLGNQVLQTVRTPACRSASASRSASGTPTSLGAPGVRHRLLPARARSSINENVPALKLMGELYRQAPSNGRSSSRCCAARSNSRRTPRASKLIFRSTSATIPTSTSSTTGAAARDRLQAGPRARPDPRAGARRPREHLTQRPRLP